MASPRGPPRCRCRAPRPRCRAARRRRRPCSGRKEAWGKHPAARAWGDRLSSAREALPWAAGRRCPPLEPQQRSPELVQSGRWAPAPWAAPARWRTTSRQTPAGDILDRGHSQLELPCSSEERCGPRPCPGERLWQQMPASLAAWPREREAAAGSVSGRRSMRGGRVRSSGRAARGARAGSRGEGCSWQFALPACCLAASLHRGLGVAWAASPGWALPS